MRQLAKERAQKRADDEQIETDREAPATPPATRSRDSESESSTPATQPSHVNLSPVDDREVIKRRASSPLPPISAERGPMWLLASLALNVAVITIAV
eukprot:3442944-Pleurochrysis_carterae.AAC.1